MASTPLSSNHDHEHHIVPTSTYFFTLIALACLMALTVFIAEFNLPAIGPLSGTVVNQTIALGIAGIKAALVISIFMGVWWSTTLTKLWAMTGFVWFTLMFIILADYTTRQYEPVRGWYPEQSSGLHREITSEEPQPLQNPNDANIHLRY